MILSYKSESVTVMNIERNKVIEFVKSLGFDPNEVSHMEITSQAIYVQTYLRDSSGQIYTITEVNGSKSVAQETRHVVITDEVAMD